MKKQVNNLPTNRYIKNILINLYITENYSINKIIFIKKTFVFLLIIYEN